MLLMPRARGCTSPLDRVPRVPPRVPRVCVPPRLGGAGTREVLVGARVWNLGAAGLEDEGLSTNVVSVVLSTGFVSTPDRSVKSHYSRTPT